MKNFAVCYNKTLVESVDVKDKLLSVFKSTNLPVRVFDIENLERGSDFVFVIGGDGTILKAARFFASDKIPVFGINLGRLGFLSQASGSDIESAIEKIINNEYTVEKRIMLKCQKYKALNDFVIKGADCGRTLKFSLKLNGKFVCDYLADGIIISTPTGSTAYGLSAGGPVLSPNLNVFVIVPICPHTLTARPIVVPDNEIITVCTDSESSCSISADGQEFFEMKNEINIEKSDEQAYLALLKDTSFYSVLREKLNWATHPKFR